MRKPCSVLILLCLFFPLVFTTVILQAQDTTQYEDPAGRFSVPVPPNWTDESTAEVGRFVGPDGVAVSILALEAPDAEWGNQAILTALAPNLARTIPTQTYVAPLPNGTWTQAVYIQEDGRFIVLVTQWVDGETYALLFDAPDQEAFTANQGQIESTILGFVVGERVDLTGVEPHPLTDEMLAELEGYIENARERFHVPGVSIAIVQNGEIVYTGGFGTTEQDGGQAITPDTLFMIGSITKSMTTMMIGTLVDQGVLDWDQPVTEILPTFALSNAAATAQIRVRDLVNMSSGVPASDTITSLAHFTPQELIASLADIPMVSAPGEMWNYNNQMVVAGGYIAALAAGTPMGGLYDGYVDLVQARVFDPIEMPDTTFDFDAAIANPNHALSFAYNPLTRSYLSVPMDGERGVLTVAPAGAVWSNAVDMARYLQTVLSGGVSPEGERIISEATLRATQTQEIPIAGSAGYGMGWFIESYKGLPLIWHGGNTRAFTSDLAFLPSAELGVVVLTNAAEANNFYKSVREYVFELAFALEHDSAEGYAAAQEAHDQAIAGMLSALSDTAVNPTTVAPFLGVYEHGVTVEVRGEELWLVGAFVEAPLHPAGAMPGTERDDYTGSVEFNAFRVRFVEAGGQLTLEITSLWTGETLTFDKVA